MHICTHLHTLSCLTLTYTLDVSICRVRHVWSGESSIPARHTSPLSHSRRRRNVPIRSFQWLVSVSSTYTHEAHIHLNTLCLPCWVSCLTLAWFNVFFDENLAFMCLWPCVSLHWQTHTHDSNCNACPQCILPFLFWWEHSIKWHSSLVWGASIWYSKRWD